MRMYSLMVALVAAAFVLAPIAATATPDAIAAAIADTVRPAEDRARDADRKPAEILALSGVEAGYRVVDVGPGAGYYSRLFSRIVGDAGKVYGFNPSWVDEMFPKAKEGVAALVTAGYANVESSIQPMAEIAFDAPVDLIFISQLYHDQHWKQVDIAKMNKAVFDALKPGGVYLVIDHNAPAGTTDAQIDKLHRIEPAVVKQEVLAAGFTLAAESDVLRNAADTLTASVFDPSIKGKTDQFVLKFVKPAK